MKTISLICTFFAGTVFSMSVYSTPITLDFTGVIKSNSDFTNSISYGVGTSFSGYVTYDVESAESIIFQESNPGNTAGFLSSNSGCVQYVNSVCVNNRGDNSPVVTDYQFVWVGGVVTPWEYSLNFQDSSRRGNIFDISPAPITGEGWDVQRNQFSIDSNGELANHNHTTTIQKQSFGLKAYSNDDSLLSDSIDNFAQGFDPDVLFLNGNSYVDVIDFISVETCLSINNCSTVYESGSYQLFGELTTASFRTVPEPTTFWLFGVGILGLLGSAKRDKKSS